VKVPLPPYGFEPWWPSRELVQALDAESAERLRSSLRAARRGALLAWSLAVFAVAAVLGALVVHVIEGPSLLRPPGVLSLLVLAGVAGWLAAYELDSARDLRARAFLRASRALEWRLAETERAAAALRRIAGGES
jgi:hypothetical protein